MYVFRNILDMSCIIVDNIIFVTCLIYLSQTLTIIKQMSMMSQLGQWTRYWHSGRATASRQSAWSSSGAAEELLGPR